jgi:two-component system sensor histidine kinase KdpD
MNLGALREITLRYATRAASRKLTAYARADHEGPSEASLGERILVAVGSAPNSAHIIRWARRTAYALRADWIALNVETGVPMRGDDRKRLEDNLELARRLGAEVIVARGSDVPKAVVEIARSKEVSMIVVGRSGLRALGAPRRSSISERIMREAAPIDIALVQDSGAQAKERPFAWLQRTFGAPPKEYAFLAAAFAALVGLGELAAPLVGYRGLAFVFLAAVLGLSLVASPGPVAVLALVSALALNFFFIPPLYTLSIGSPEDWLLFAVYFLVAFETSSLVSRVRSRESLLREREHTANFLFGASQVLSDSHSVEEAAAAASTLIRAHFGADAFILVDDGDGRLSRPTESGLPDHDFDVASYAYAERVVCGARTGTLPGAHYHYVPAFSGEEAVGVIGVNVPPEAVWTSASDDLLQSLGRTLALAVLRRRSDERSRDASIRLESERLGGILLDSVSHELRTPLTAITGALSALGDEELASKPETRRDLVANALEQSDALNGVVEDLLSLSRIEAGILRLKRAWVDLPELAAAGVERAGSELSARRVEIVAADDAAAFVDAALVARLAANLLRNAARYSPSEEPIAFRLEERTAQGGALYLCVRDHGPGLPPEELSKVFDKFARGRDAKGKGLGLGLAICKGIAEAHGGSIQAKNASGGGLEIAVILPYGRKDSP